MTSTKGSLLIVDDDIAFCETLSDILKEKGYNCVSVYSGKDALKRLKKERFDIILMDINMPVMNGIQTVREIKKEYPAAVVIMMTAFSLEDLIKDALKEGVYGILRKPLDVAKIVSTIEAAREEAALVMVVDDDINTRKTLRDVLEQKGFSVTLAKNGEEAVNFAKVKPHDVIMVDVKLPVLNGLETYLEIKKINPKVKAVFMTAYREETKDLVNEALRHSAYACLYKPFDVEAAVELVRELFKVRR